MPKLAIIVSRYRREITYALCRNCLKTLVEKGVPKKNIDIFYVPGALETPFFTQKLAKKKKYNAIIVFGCVLKGTTHHFKIVAEQSARGLMDVSLKYDIPVINQILPVYKLKDAKERAMGKKDNRGEEGAKEALELIKTIEEAKNKLKSS